MKKKKSGEKIKQTLFPPTLFWVFFVTLLLMSGIHQGLVVLINENHHWPSWIQVNIPLVYWLLVAVFLTVYTRIKIRKTYEEPVHRLAHATRLVASGDFSIYVPTIHTREKYDYLDVMILDFNKMVEELGSVEILKTDFFSNVSHEIKTPLAVIQSNVELLQKEELSKIRHKECTKNILQATKRLSSLISNMLKLNKLEKQVIQPVPEQYDVCRQLCECALQFEAIWEQKQVEFEAELEEKAFLMADEGLMELVWNNLLSNAFKFTPPGGTVRLIQKSDGEKIVVSVTDTGCGMDRETIGHIFDKFYQGDTSHAMEGNGLGLALVKRVLDLLNGHIHVESKLGVGSSFQVELPIGQPDTGKESEGKHENEKESFWK